MGFRLHLLTFNKPHPTAAPMVDPKYYSIGDMHLLTKPEKEQAKAAINEELKEENWYRNLRYAYSGMNTYSTLNVHVFNLLIKHNGRTWILKVRHWLNNKNMPSIEITAEPYTAETYVDYEKALEMAIKSCSKSQ
ncbi:hypothetical protein IB260_07990 [Pseudomonas sp. PDM23]|uniref:hypothetical protein n=1 Tax=unclassified Pseudomonas TaxID=196821 RepID=UPI00177F7D84|nr:MULTISPECIES: hypothetical protein [unclassified Pseudomonas]MBD9575243.1 hypothetical protein [Pseudomonas sp. PDM23]MBD9669815.1 hypothetical protein [Pseudomonas sp. PDM21]